MQFLLNTLRKYTKKLYWAFAELFFTKTKDEGQKTKDEGRKTKDEGLGTGGMNNE